MLRKYKYSLPYYILALSSLQKRTIFPKFVFSASTSSKIVSLHELWPEQDDLGENAPFLFSQVLPALFLTIKNTLLSPFEIWFMLSLWPFHPHVLCSLVFIRTLLVFIAPHTTVIKRTAISVISLMRWDASLSVISISSASTTTF